MPQKCITGLLGKFDVTLNEHFEQGWMLVPETFKVIPVPSKPREIDNKGTMARGLCVNYCIAVLELTAK